MGERPFLENENPKDAQSRRRRASRARDEATEHFYTARPVLGAPEEEEAWDGQDGSFFQEAAREPWAPQAPGFPYAPNEPWEPGAENLSFPALEAYNPNEASGDWVDCVPEEPDPEWEEASQDGAEAPQLPAWTSPASSYYCRPSVRQEGEDPGETAFAPPPKLAHMLWEEPLEEPASASAAPKRNVYQPREATWAQTARMNDLALQGAQDQVEATKDKSRAKRSKGRKARRVLAAVCAVAVLGGAAYLGRDWLSQQIALLTGAETVSAGQQGAGDAPALPDKGYDSAPQPRLGAKAQQGIAAVSGTLEMEPVAVTTANVLTRTPVGGDLYDYYLFAGTDGRLLAYFDALPATDFIAQPNDSFYVSKSPYLLNSQGKALIRPEAYRQAAGEGAVLGPLENGWALIRNAAGTKFNYISAEGKLLSALWFARAFPFWGERTLAYVDTGNLAKPEERYSLYVLSREGEMDFWRHAADTREVVNAACDLALLTSGELVRLADLTTVALVDEAAAYLDCEAVVAKERDSGKYGLFVGGEQHYDFAYAQIAPVPCEIQWDQQGEGPWVNYAVTGAQYPQPLSHYFRLQKPNGQEQVALSTRSCCPVLLK